DASPAAVTNTHAGARQADLHALFEWQPATRVQLLLEGRGDVGVPSFRFQVQGCLRAVSRDETEHRVMKSVLCDHPNQFAGQTVEPRITGKCSVPKSTQPAAASADPKIALTAAEHAS